MIISGIGLKTFLIIVVGGTMKKIIMSSLLIVITAQMQVFTQEIDWHQSNTLLECGQKVDSIEFYVNESFIKVQNSEYGYGLIVFINGKKCIVTSSDTLASVPFFTSIISDGYINIVGEIPSNLEFAYGQKKYNGQLYDIFFFLLDQTKTTRTIKIVMAKAFDRNSDYKPEKIIYYFTEELDLTKI